MKWESETTWITSLDSFAKGYITKSKNEYKWNITYKELDFGFGDFGGIKTVAHGKESSLKEAKNKIKNEYKKYRNK